MIEIEKGFALTKEQEKKLIEGAEFLGEKKFTDTYYDDKDFSLTTKDIWFRKRDNCFELKIPLNKPIKERASDQYEEIENEKDILRYFGAPANRSLEDFLKEKEYEPFCKITTTRRKYRKEGFNIDLDSADFGYEIAEIEKMINDSSQAEIATKSIINFAAKHNITPEHEEEYGKGVEYIRRNNPHHFQALINAKVIK